MLSTARKLWGWGASSVQNLKTCEIILLRLNNSPDFSNFNGMVQQRLFRVHNDWHLHLLLMIFGAKKPTQMFIDRFSIARLGGGGVFQLFIRICSVIGKKDFKKLKTSMDEKGPVDPLHQQAR